MADPNIDPVVRSHRERISENDRRLVEALNERVRLVSDLKDYKESRGLGFHDAAREERVLALVCQASGGPASEAGLRELFALILKWTKREVARLGEAGDG